MVSGMCAHVSDFTPSLNSVSSSIYLVYLDAELPIHMADKFHPEVFKIDGVYNNNWLKLGCQ